MLKCSPIIYLMCIKLNCKTSACGCCNDCKCDRRCFECYTADKFNPPGCTENLMDISNVRNKYVCLSCKRIWKSSVSKYICYGNYDELDRHNIPNYDKQRNWSDRVELIHSYLNVYRNKTSKCPKCKMSGLLVGRNFRHCKTNKEWDELTRKVKNEEINLQTDFHDYPKYNP
jgi:hypothetical protein